MLNKSRHSLIAGVILCCLLTSGCLSRQVASDGENLRRALVDLYTDQAMDNLIRAYENRPFVHLAYSQLSVTDKDALVATAAGGETDFSSGRVTDLTKAAALQMARTSNFSGKFPLGTTGQRDRILSFHADPVTDKNYIYEAYLDFARNPGLFVASDCKPCCPVHIARQCGKRWYWVPVEAGDEFLQLVVKTSFAPPPAAPPEVFWESSIESVVPRYNKNGEPVPGNYVVTLTKEVPNDAGLMQLILKDSRKPWLSVLALLVMPYKPGEPNQKEEPGLLRGAPTKMLYVQFSADMVPADEALLPGAPILFLSQNYPNQSPKAAADAQKVLDLLDNIRIQLIKSNPNSP